MENFLFFAASHLRTSFSLFLSEFDQFLADRAAARAASSAGVKVVAASCTQEMSQGMQGKW